MSDSEDENPLVLESFTTLNPRIGYSRMGHFKNCLDKYIGVNKIKSFKKIKSEILKVHDENSLTRQNIVDFGKKLKGVKGNENAIFMQITGKTVDTFVNWEK